jgi:NAD(P)-dependent dehydrogenase (short-subunit alcohol dehydrogenase family)
VDVNLNGVFYTCVEFGRRMVARRRGSVVVTASMSGIIVNTPQAQASYNASKAGAAHLAKSLAVEWAPSGVRVNALAPGYIATELTMRGRSNPEWGSRWVQGTPLGRLGEPDEVAACALFLAVDASSFVTGSVLVVDGGYTAL